MERTSELRASPIPVNDEIRPGDSLPDKLLAAVETADLAFSPGDILVVKHKIVSKAEGRIVPLSSVQPSQAATDWATQYGLDPRVIELALRESRRIVRQQNGVLITETQHGLICANSGVDVSNVDGGQSAVLLPEDPDRSAAQLHRALHERLQLAIPVIISDSFGRPWREGLCEVAIGVAGMRPLLDYRGRRDPHGYRLRVTQEAVADELACVAGLVCGKLARTPACVIRGFRYPAGKGRAVDLIRPRKLDLFR